MQTTDFQVFLDHVNLSDDIEDIYSLWMAAQGTSDGLFDAKPLPNGALSITGPDNHKLYLASEKAQKAFLYEVEKLNPEPDLSMHGALMAARGTRKDD